MTDNVGRDRVGRRPQLDGLRGVAALVVLVGHALVVSPALADVVSGAARPGVRSWTWWVSYTPLHLGWAGSEAVYVFFVLSGLVLALPAAAGVAVDWRAYYPQRLLRLYLPIIGATVFAYLLVLAVPRVPTSSSSWWLATHTSPVGLREAGRAAGAVLGYQRLNSAFWSLEWEVYFSLLLPVFLLLLRLGRSAAPAAAGVLVGVVALGGATGTVALTYLPMFGLGVLMARHLDALDQLGDRFDRLPRITRAGVAFSTVVLVLIEWPIRAAGLGATWIDLGRAASAAGAAAMVWLVACTSGGRGVATPRAVRWLGLRSFSLYLVHEPIVVTTAYLVGGGPHAGLVLVVALPASLLAAEAFGRLIEVPAHRLSRSVGAWIRSRPRRVVSRT